MPPSTEVTRRPVPPAQASREDELVALLTSAPALARLALLAWWRATGWTARNGIRVTVRLMRAAAEGEAPAELLDDATTQLRSFLRELIDAADLSPAASPPAAPASPASTAAAERDGTAPVPVASLRARGADLLRRSAAVHGDNDAHPAYVHILEDVAPDEARILRLLAEEGPQASVDVRSAGPLRLGVGSELVAPGLNIIGDQAGCRHPARVPRYLNNLHRLGLVWFSREPLEDQSVYQVLEAQPHVTDALESVRRGRIVRRSIHLTPFGIDFCDTCLPLERQAVDSQGAPATGD